ncbi:hypothetical protein [Psychrobacter sp. I-STPA6b]|uniref:hypothetical protein n=1 Tax=Psychrobacter sp. I-STPA6b TaxID=2585718 RepID=UPI001D0C5B30|nr:hypothetical protein [Psychrobacter sp. I-STPA6b]
MSEYKFSHQFSQRWLTAPQQVKQAIVQELEDIITLLDNETDLNSFQFRQPDLNAHIQHLYQQEQEAAQKSEPLEVTLPTQNNITNNHILDNNTHLSMSASHDIPHIEEVTHEDTINQASHTTISDTKQQNTEQLTTQEKSVHNELTEADSEQNTTVTSTECESLIYELESRIDDYLSEQMAQLSIDLKSWLRNEVKHYFDK